MTEEVEAIWDILQMSEVIICGAPLLLSSVPEKAERKKSIALHSLKPKGWFPQHYQHISPHRHLPHCIQAGSGNPTAQKTYIKTLLF